MKKQIYFLFFIIFSCATARLRLPNAFTTSILYYLSEFISIDFGV